MCFTSLGSQGSPCVASELLLVIAVRANCTGRRKGNVGGSEKKKYYLCLLFGRPAFYSLKYAKLKTVRVKLFVEKNELKINAVEKLRTAIFIVSENQQSF